MQCHLFHWITESPLGGFQILTGNTAASDVTDLDAFDQCKNYTADAPVGQTLNVACDVTRLARYVAIVRRASDVKLHFCEVEVLGAVGESCSLANVLAALGEFAALGESVQPCVSLGSLV